MPCRDENYLDRLDEMGERLHKVTRLLCTTLGTLGSYNRTPSSEVFEILMDNKELAAWWSEHQEQDRKRIQAEKLREEKARKKAQALKKLSPEERKLLGI